MRKFLEMAACLQQDLSVEAVRKMYAHVEDLPNGRGQLRNNGRHEGPQPLCVGFQRMGLHDQHLLICPREEGNQHDADRAVEGFLH